MKINDLKENYTLPGLSYDKYGMPDYNPYLEIISKAFKEKSFGKVQIQRFLEDKLGIRARLARELIQKWEKVNKEKIPMKLNAEAGGGGGGAGGGGAGGGGAAGGTGGATGGATGGTSSGGDGGLQIVVAPEIVILHPPIPLLVMHLLWMPLEVMLF
jgi:hypothetical protein